MLSTFLLISLTAVGIINIPTEKELIAAMEEIREKSLKTAGNKGKRCNPHGLHRILHSDCPLEYDSNSLPFLF